MTARRLRVRLSRKPLVLWGVQRFNIIENYLKARDLEVVHREVLEDLNAVEDQVKRTNEPLAYIKPQSI
jgi:hypothetical protein